VRWSSPVEVIWTRYREAPPQHGGVREAGFAQAVRPGAPHRPPGIARGHQGNPSAIAAVTGPPGHDDRARSAACNGTRRPRLAVKYRRDHEAKDNP
jgi:hypothetical protein